MSRTGLYMVSWLMVAGAALALAEHCYIQGPTVDCVQCTNEAPGPLCGGSACDDSVDTEIDIFTLVEALDQEAGHEPDTSPGGSCYRTYRTCINGKCVSSNPPVVQSCTNQILGEETCTGGHPE